MSAPTSYAPGAPRPWRAWPTPPCPRGRPRKPPRWRAPPWAPPGRPGWRCPEGCAEGSARQAIQAALDEVVAEMSTWEDHSDITGYNRAGPGWHALPASGTC